MSPRSRLPLVVTPGDPDGIGPEIVWKSIRQRRLWDPRGNAVFFAIGAEEPFKRLGARLKLLTPDDLHDPALFTRIRRAPSVLHLYPAPKRAARPSQHLAGYQSGWSISQAAELMKRGGAHALVTGPISKERLRLGGFNYPGHTEFLANLAGCARVTMMLANEQLRVSLVTTHLPLSKVSTALTPRLIGLCIDQTVHSLRQQWGIRKPRVAIAGLNPHAGENGLFGNEERRLILPAVEASRRRWKNKAVLCGPLPADTLFAQHLAAPKKQQWDAVVCQYHDQGLIPVKLLDFPKTVNVTLGLPWIRTSVDHGTGFDIAGMGIADPSSFQSAIRLGMSLRPPR